MSSEQETTGFNMKLVSETEPFCFAGEDELLYASTHVFSPAPVAERRADADKSAWGAGSLDNR